MPQILPLHAGDYYHTMVKSNHCEHIHIREEAVYCIDCNYICCNHCLKNGLCQECINHPNGQTVLRRDPNAKKCPTCNHMCRHLESIIVTEETSCCMNVKSYLCCAGCLIMSVFIPGGSSTFSHTDSSDGKHTYLQLRYHCRKCNKTFFDKKVPTFYN